MPPPKYILTFAGIPFLEDSARIVRLTTGTSASEVPEQLPPRKHQPESDLIDEINRQIPMQYLQDFTPPSTYLGRNLGAVAFEPHSFPNPTVRVGDWYYPRGAARWSVFRGLATTSQVEAMLLQTKGFLAKPFHMKAWPISPDKLDETFYDLQTDMFMLPPRPLAEHGGQFDGLYLVTLVDNRFYFQGNAVDIHVTEDSKWSDLITQLATVLGVSTVYSTIEAAYVKPEADSQLWSSRENAAVLMDAVAINIGRVLVRRLDGIFHLLTPAESQTIVLANRGSNVVRTAGGDIFNSGNSLNVPSLSGNGGIATMGDFVRNSISPQAIQITYPKYSFDGDTVPHLVNSRYAPPRPSAWFEESYGSTHLIQVPITSGGTLVSGTVGVPGNTSLFKDTAKALFATEASIAPTNLSGLTALSMQIAGDRYGWLVGAGLDEVYPGTFIWDPEGFHDIIWTYSTRSRLATTRIMRTEWNLATDTFQHSTPTVEAPADFGLRSIQKGIGGPSVSQSIRDSFDDFDDPAPETTLAVVMASGDQRAIFNQVDYFPTQNRWRGKIDGEVILFEGTSGGIGASGVLSSGVASGTVASGIGSGLLQSGGYAVDVVYRAIDGTPLALHSGNNQVTQMPNVGYGVNLTTYEKGQFTYPSEWTSGGIQGMNIVPQTQTVLCLDGDGVAINNVTHCSGRVQLFNAQQPTSGGGWANQELVWLIDRNATSGQTTLMSGHRYGGQLMGTSASLTTLKAGQKAVPAPIYVVDFTSNPSFPARLLDRVATTCPPDDSGSNNSSVNYSYGFVGLKRTIGTDGCHEWAVDPTRHGVAYGKNNRKLDVPVDVDIEIVALTDERNLGSGSGGVLNCCNIGTTLPNLVGTVTDKVGLFTSLPDTLNFADASPAISGAWSVSFPPVSCTGPGIFFTKFVIFCVDMTLHVDASCNFALNGVNPASATCSPVSAVYYLNDGLGNSCTVTVAGEATTGTEFIFDDGASSETVCLKPGLVYSIDMDCDGMHFIKYLYATPITWDANNCYGPGAIFLVASSLTTWPCNPCVPCDSGSGSGSGSGTGSCAPCQSTYCLEFAWSGSPGPECQALQNKGISLVNPSCTTTFGFGTGEWRGDTILSDGTHFYGSLFRYCFLDTGGTVKYRWYVYAYYLGSGAGCGRPLIQSPTDATAPLFIGEGTDPNTPPTVTGFSNCLDCVSQNYVTGAWTLVAGPCPEASGSGTLCPCTWTGIGLHGGCTYFLTAGDPAVCITPPSAPCVVGAVKNTNGDGTDCSSIIIDGPKCSDCDHNDRHATITNTSGAFKTCATPVLMHYQADGDYWISVNVCPCESNTLNCYFVCIDNVWYVGFDGMTELVAANAGGTCGNLSFTLVNVTTACGTGSCTVTVTP